MKKTLFVIISISLLSSGCALPQETKRTSPIAGEQNKTTVSARLDLSNDGITKIPEYVFGETNLEELNVANNQITGAIQAEIRHLQKLKILNLSNNQMTGLPAEIGQLKNLEILDVSNNELTGLPYELGNLKNLKTLNISGNNYSELDLDTIQKNLPQSTNIIK